MAVCTERTKCKHDFNLRYAIFFNWSIHNDASQNRLWRCGLALRRWGDSRHANMKAKFDSRPNSNFRQLAYRVVIQGLHETMTAVPLSCDLCIHGNWSEVDESSLNDDYRVNYKGALPFGLVPKGPWRICYGRHLNNPCLDRTFLIIF